MKRTLIIIFFFPILSFGQSKFSFGVNIGAKAGILRLSDAHINRSISQEAKPNIGYSVGLDVTYFFKNHYFFRSGFGFENSRFLLETKGVVWGACIDASNGVVREINYYDVPTIKSIQIPLDFGYLLPREENDLKIFMGAGIQYNIILKTETTQRQEKEGMDDVRDTFDSNIDVSPVSGKIFFGVEYPLFSKVNLIIEPVIKFTPNKFELNFLAEGTSLVEPGIVVRLNF